MGIKQRCNSSVSSAMIRTFSILPAIFVKKKSHAATNTNPVPASFSYGARCFYCICGGRTRGTRSLGAFCGRRSHGFSAVQKTDYSDEVGSFFRGLYPASARLTRLLVAINPLAFCSFCSINSPIACLAGDPSR